MTDFLTDVATLRERARANIDYGPLTASYGADRVRVLSVLNDALATELVCVLRYKRHHFTAKGLSSGEVAAEFAQHAVEEAQHADLLAARISQLGGEPDFNPDTLTHRSHSEYDASAGLLEMIREDLVAERIAIAAYTEIAAWLGDKDPTSRRVIETILEQEEEHADDLVTFLEQMEPPD